MGNINIKISKGLLIGAIFLVVAIVLLLGGFLIFKAYQTPQTTREKILSMLESYECNLSQNQKVFFENYPILNRSRNSEINGFPVWETRTVLPVVLGLEEIDGKSILIGGVGNNMSGCSKIAFILTDGSDGDKEPVNMIVFDGQISKFEDVKESLSFGEQYRLEYLSQKPLFEYDYSQCGTDVETVRNCALLELCNELGCDYNSGEAYNDYIDANNLVLGVTSVRSLDNRDFPTLPSSISEEIKESSFTCARGSKLLDQEGVSSLSYHFETEYGEINWLAQGFAVEVLDYSSFSEVEYMVARYENEYGCYVVPIALTLPKSISTVYKLADFDPYTQIFLNDEIVDVDEFKSQYPIGSIVVPTLSVYAKQFDELLLNEYCKDNLQACYALDVARYFSPVGVNDLLRPVTKPGAVVFSVAFYPYNADE